MKLDLAHGSSRSNLYLIGGAGRYREQLHLRQFALEQGTFCDFYFCEFGLVPVLTAVDRTTSSWNTGLGWEVSNADGFLLY